MLLHQLCSPPEPQGKGLPGVEVAELFLSPKDGVSQGDEDLG